MTKTERVFSPGLDSMYEEILLSVSRNEIGQLIWQFEDILSWDIPIVGRDDSIINPASTSIDRRLTEEEERHYRAEQTMKEDQDEKPSV